MALGYSDITGFDIQQNRMKNVKRKYGIKICSNPLEIINQNPDLIIIDKLLESLL